MIQFYSHLRTTGHFFLRSTTIRIHTSSPWDTATPSLQLSRYPTVLRIGAGHTFFAAYKLEIEPLISFGRSLFSVGVGVGAFFLH